ncbi:hypothetical protein [Chlorogloeopsis sp. ULAP02]|uniref:hypothetical protein n=1 Tax=Chlorogloeopsis sp. ULAP02 TaxID=3107926 RepID=UPI003134F37D
MSLLKKLPWLSLILLLLTFISLGWVLSAANPPYFIWVLVAIAIFFLVASLTSPLTRIADYSLNLFTSNLRSFSVTVLAAFLFFLIFARFRLFLDIFVILAALMLVRIDFQTAGFREVQAFCIISIFSLTGLVMGAFIERIMFQYNVYS